MSANERSTIWQTTTRLSCPTPEIDNGSLYRWLKLRLGDKSCCSIENVCRANLSCDEALVESPNVNNPNLSFHIHRHKPCDRPSDAIATFAKPMPNGL